MRLSFLALAAFTAAIFAPSTAAQEQGSDSRNLFVLGALHGLHESEDSFDFGGLRQIVEAARPDIIVIEVRPDELADRKSTPGRPEYPAVIWPLLTETGIEAVAMEPGGALFTAITTPVGQAFEALRRNDPATADYVESLRRSLETALQAHWRHPADSQDRVTADLVRAYDITQSELVGGGYDDLQRRWDDHMVTQAREVVLANPDRRILVVGSFRNRHVLEEGLRAAAGHRLVDMEAWLRAIGSEPAAAGRP